VEIMNQVRMIADRNFGNSEPLTWIGTFPVYLATAIALVQTACLALTAVAMAAGGAAIGMNPYLTPVTFSWQTAGAEAQLWQFLTYAFVNPPSIWVIIQLVLLAIFGAEIEKMIGRRPFFWLYSVLLLTGPLVLSIGGLVGMNALWYGSQVVNFTVFVAFAILFPRAEIFFGIQARWIAAVFVGIATLQYVAARDVFSGVILWSTIAAGFLFLKLDDFPTLTRAAAAKVAKPVKPKRPKKKPSARAKKKQNPEVQADVHDSIDPILEKISSSGIASLTPTERERLEKARNKLIQEGKPRV